MEGHYSPIWYSQCTWQYWCQGTLYASPCAHRTNAWSPVAYSSGTNCDLWRVTSGVLLGTHLSAQLKCSFYQNPHKDCGWPGHVCQPGTTGGPPDREFGGVHQQPPKGWILEALDLQGLGEWPILEQGQARELLIKWEYLFAHSDLDLGRTALIKHKIEVTDLMPFKEHYQHIPPHMCDDMKSHLQEMLEIGAIKKSHSPWASAVVLVQKKDGSLRFCIGLRKLNNWTIKDVYSLPQIDETLDSLQGSHWFSSLNMKSGHWQVKMDKESTPLTTFTVGLLGFYECERMPFGLANTPATFQRLMETCLRDHNLHWCIIHLDDIVIFSKDPAGHLESLEAVFW